MSTQTLEKLIREMQNTMINTMEGLTSRILSLEAKVSEQSAIIVSLSTTSTTTHSAQTTRKSLTFASPKAPIVTASVKQRPIRSVRATAGATKAGLASTSAAPKQFDRTSEPKASENDTIGVKEKKDTGRLESAQQNARPKATETTQQVSQPIIISTAGKQKSDTSVITDIDNKDEEADGQWRLVTSRRRRLKQRPIFIGNNATHELQAAEQIKYIQAWRFKTDTTTEQVVKFLKKIENAEYSVEKRDIKSTNHASFLIGIPENIYDRVTKTSVWPKGIRFTEWFFRSHPRPVSLPE